MSLSNCNITYVRPHLEFAVQAWSPWSAADKCRRGPSEWSERKGIPAGCVGPNKREERRHQADMTPKDDVDQADRFCMARDAARFTRTAWEAGHQEKFFLYQSD